MMQNDMRLRICSFIFKHNPLAKNLLTNKIQMSWQALYVDPFSMKDRTHSRQTDGARKFSAVSMSVAS